MNSPLKRDMYLALCSLFLSLALGELSWIVWIRFSTDSLRSEWILSGSLDVRESSSSLLNPALLSASLFLTSIAFLIQLVIVSFICCFLSSILSNKCKWCFSSLLSLSLFLIICFPKFLLIPGANFEFPSFFLSMSCISCVRLLSVLVLSHDFSWRSDLLGNSAYKSNSKDYLVRWFLFSTQHLGH